LLVFFRLKRAGGIQEIATRRQAPKRGCENLLLTSSLPGKVGGLEPMTDLRVSPQSPSATARNIAKDKVEDPFTLRKPSSIRLKHTNLGRNRVETGRKSLKMPRIGIGSQQLSIAMATRKDERLAARSGAAVPYALRRCMGNRSQLSNQAGAIVKVKSFLREILLGEEAA